MSTDIWRECCRGDGLFLALALAVPALSAGFLGIGLRLRWFADGSSLPRWARVASWNAGAAFLLVSLAHLAGEGYFRFGYLASDSGTTRVYQRWATRHLRLNDAGFRDDVEYTFDPKPGKRRIVFLGDSFTVGHGVRVEERFANLIRQARSDRWEVHTVARLGLNTGDELSGLRMLNPGYRFSVIVLVYVLNDIEDLSPECLDIQARLTAEMEQAGFLVRHGYFINFLAHRWREWRNPSIPRYEKLLAAAYDAQPWDRQREGLLEILGEAKRRQVPLLVVTFPMLHRLGDGYPYRAVHRKLDAFWQSAGVPHLDLLPVFDGRARRELMVNRHDGHPSALAHRLAAEAMIPFFDATSSVPPPNHPAQAPP